MRALTTLLCTLVTLASFADTPDAILKDYRAKAVTSTP